MRYRRILLKLSGEVLKGKLDNGIDNASVSFYAQEIKSLNEAGYQVAMVIGGGNMIRGKQIAAAGTERATADYMGMLATVINGLALQDALEKIGVYTRLQSAIHMEQIAEPYIRRRAVRHLEKGRVVLFAAGTGNPYFSTDTAAALRACEIGADVFIKGTKVDGVFTADPEKDKDAKRFLQLTYQDAIEKNLGVLDDNAFVICRDNTLPIIVCDVTRQGRLAEVLNGTGAHTVVKNFTNSVLA